MEDAKETGATAEDSIADGASSFQHHPKEDRLLAVHLDAAHHPHLTEIKKRLDALRDFLVLRLEQVAHLIFTEALIIW